MTGILQITVERKDTIDIVYLSGRLDANTSAEADAVLSRLIAAGSRNILVNFQDLDYISSSGLRVMLLAFQNLRKNQGDLKLACLKPVIREIFHLVGFDRIFLLYETEDEAFRSFGYVALDEKERRIMEVVASTIDIEEDRRRTEVSLKQSETLYRAIFENTGTAMAIVDEDMTIFLANSEFEKMVGYTKREMEEVASFLAFVASDDAEKVKEFHNLIRKDMESRPRHYEFRLKDRAGNIRNIHVTLDMIPETPRTVYSLIDITELRKIEDDLRYELTRKREFITIAAHELRTPLQPVLGYLQLLLEDPDAYCLNAEVRGILDTCRKNAEQERQMVDQIVRLSGLGCGPEQMLPRFRPQYREMSPNNLLKSRISLLSCPHESSIAIEIPENLRIRTDSEYFYLIIESLLFNAFRHSTGPANIEISCHGSEQTNSFAIRNTRTVISPEIMANLFRPFYVGDESKLRKKFGFIGLSLPLVKKMAEMLGGDITASSRPGTGTVFTLTLPKSVE